MKKSNVIRNTALVSKYYIVLKRHSLILYVCLFVKVKKVINYLYKDLKHLEAL